MSNTYPPGVQRVLRSRTRAAGWIKLDLIETINGMEIRKRVPCEAGCKRYVVGDRNGRHVLRTNSLEGAREFAATCADGVAPTLPPEERERLARALLRANEPGRKWKDLDSVVRQGYLHLADMTPERLRRELLDGEGGGA